ncbi:MAG: CvpA family protein [Patescibacteria group bacterium]
MAIFDIVLVVLFFGFVGAGFYFGFIHTLGAVIGTVVGVLVASNFYGAIAPFFQFFMLKEGVANTLAFIIIFLLVSRLVGYLAHLFDQGFKIIRFIPFASSANRLAGALFGFFEATLVLGTILFVTSQFQISPAVNAAIDSSAFAGLLMTIAQILTPLIPESLKVRVIGG